MGTYGYLVSQLNGRNLAYLHLLEASHTASQPSHYPTEIAKTFRPLYTGSLIASSGLTKAKAEHFLENRIADLVAFGSAFIANPDLVERFRTDAPLAVGDRKTYYTGGEKGYTDYPFLTES
jgi:N-ethylmaleimide reductase